MATWPNNSRDVTLSRAKYRNSLNDIFSGEDEAQALRRQEMFKE
jgi:hypothetical protein